MPGARSQRVVGRRLDSSRSSPLQPAQQSKTPQQRSLRARWSSSTRSRTASGSCARCQRHSSRPAASASAGGACGPGGLDRVGRGPEVVRGDVRDAGGLAGRVGSPPSGSTQLPGRAHGVAARRARPHHRQVAARPGPPCLDRLTWARVVGTHGLEGVEHVLRAGCRPQREEVVVGIREGATAPDRDEAGVGTLREGSPRHRPTRRAPVRPVPLEVRSRRRGPCC